MQTPTNDILDQNSLRAALGKDAEGLSVYAFEELDSTNTYAKRLSVNGCDTPALIVAERQTAGRGRMGREFFSPDKTGVYFSISYTAHASLESAVSVTCAASVAVMRAIRKLCGVQTQIKWVNDLYLNGKKVCGILTEAVTANGDASRIIVGIGINLSTAAFPDGLIDKAGSLGCTNVSRAELIAAVWQALKPYLSDPANTSWLADYRTYSCVIGKPISWTRGEEHFFGTAIGIDSRGALAVRLSDGTTEYLRTGEISVKVDPQIF